MALCLASKRYGSKRVSGTVLSASASAACCNKQKPAFFPPVCISRTILTINSDFCQSSFTCLSLHCGRGLFTVRSEQVSSPFSFFNNSAIFYEFLNKLWDLGSTNGLNSLLPAVNYITWRTREIMERLNTSAFCLGLLRCWMSIDWKYTILKVILCAVRDTRMETKQILCSIQFYGD